MRTARLLTSASVLALMAGTSWADDTTTPLVPLPQGYDLVIISRGPASVTPGLGLDKRNMPEATIIEAVPAAGGTPKTRIEWSGYVRAGVVYQHSD